jgi:hypothetical membrane protein
MSATTTIDRIDYVSRDTARWWLLAGIAGPILWYSVMAVLSATTPGYNWIATYASDLSIGPTGWIMQAGFVACGVLEVVFAFGLLRAGAARAGAVLTGTAGLGFVGAGLFVTDPHGTLVTSHGALHVASAMVIFVSVSVAAFLLRHRPGLGRWYTALAYLAAFATLPLFASTWMAGPVLGIVQRLMLAIDLGWLCWLAAGARRIAVTGPAARRPASHAYTG